MFRSPGCISWTRVHFMNSESELSFVGVAQQSVGRGNVHFMDLTEGAERRSAVCGGRGRKGREELGDIVARRDNWKRRGAVSEEPDAKRHSLSLPLPQHIITATHTLSQRISAATRNT
eukprot:1483653-Rhodomonas_salina.5